MKIEITEIKNGFIVKAIKGYWQNNDPMDAESWEHACETRVFLDRESMMNFILNWKDACGL